LKYAILALSSVIVTLTFVSRPHTGRRPPLIGRVRDQAELHGLLSKIRDLNLALLAVITQ
jgi:hypothetical protein